MGFEAKFDECTVVLEPLTQNTFVLVVAADPRVGESSVWWSSELADHLVETALIQYNIYNSQPHMADFAKRNNLERKCR